MVGATSIGLVVILWERSTWLMKSGPYPGPGRFWEEGRWELLSDEEEVVREEGGTRKKRGVLGEENCVFRYLEVERAQPIWRVSSGSG